MSDTASQAPAGPTLGSYTGPRSATNQRDGPAARNVFPNGDIYKGAYKEGKRSGQGMYVWKSGGKYVGEYDAGERNGKGTLWYPDGGIYEGNFVNGKKHGFGKYTFSNGDIYEGEWSEDKKHGNGKYVYKQSGSVKSGTFVNGTLRGAGELKHAGYKVSGNYVDNTAFAGKVDVFFESTQYKMAGVEASELGFQKAEIEGE